MTNYRTYFYLGSLGLFVGAIICELLAIRFKHRKILLYFFTAFLSVVAMICAFIIGATIEEIMIPFLILLWLGLRSQVRGGGEKK